MPTARCSAPTEKRITPVHGFYWLQDGTYTSFDPPGSINTVPTAISETGLITGYLNGTDHIVHAFVRQNP
jgi:hypothetical protein